MKRRLVVFILAGLVGCSASKVVVPQTPPPPAVLAPSATLGSSQTTPSVRKFDESILHGKEFLLQAWAPEVPKVRDPVVGTLSRDEVIVRTVEALFRSVFQGNLEPDTLVPRWATYLQGWAKKLRDEGLVSGTIRVGEAQISTNENVFVPVRIFDNQKVLSGWVDLSKDGKGYLVSDLQIVESMPRQARIDPESADQSISSPTRR